MIKIIFIRSSGSHSPSSIDCIWSGSPTISSSSLTSSTSMFSRSSTNTLLEANGLYTPISKEEEEEVQRKRRVRRTPGSERAMINGETFTKVGKLEMENSAKI